MNRPPLADGIWQTKSVQIIMSKFPRGIALGEDVWKARHRFLVRVAMLHVPVLVAIGIAKGVDLTHTAVEVGIVAVAAGVAYRAATRTAQATFATVSLLLSSALLVHFTDGLIESHFHFFVVLPLIALYQDWRPFLTAIGFVLFHHGVVGVLDPSAVYNHPAAIANPILWAFIHAGYVLGLVAVLVFHWRFAERSEGALRESAASLVRANRMLYAVTECNDVLVRAKEETSLLQDVCRIVVEGGYPLAWVGYAGNDESKTVQPVARWGNDTGYVERLNLTWADTELGWGPAGRAIRTRTPVVVPAIASDPAFSPWADAALERGYQSTIAVPLAYGDDILGVLAVYAAEVGAFDAPEVETLQRFAAGLAFGIKALRTRELQEAAEQQLRRMLRTKDEFVATIAHELRTPLTAVVGFAQILLAGGSAIPAGERAEMMGMLVDQGIDLTNIVDDLLVAAKAEAGTLTVDRVPVDLRAQTAQVLEGWEQAAASHLEFSGPSTTVIGDPARVRQILRNVISNALRYGGQRIQVCVASTGSTAHVTVSDDGIGVPPEDSESIFEPYQRAHNNPGLTASMGLGLTVSRQLARLMDGDLTYRHDHGQSAFTLTLPLTNQISEPALSTTATPNRHNMAAAI
jgi:signal transduction histidine kinase